MASSLDIAGINKRFGKGDKSVEVLRKVDIHVAPGEFLILVGPSGCGKSTLLNIIAGLDEPTEGEIRIGGKNVVGMPPRDRDIAMVFQSYALYPTLSVADNIGFALEMRKVPKADREKRINEVAAMRLSLPQKMADEFDMTDTRRVGKDVTYTYQFNTQEHKASTFDTEAGKQVAIPELCNTKATREYLDAGYRFVFTYLFKDGSDVVVHITAADCKA